MLLSVFYYRDSSQEFRKIEEKIFFFYIIKTEAQREKRLGRIEQTVSENIKLSDV